MLSVGSEEIKMSTVRVKILYLAKIMLQYSDEDHKLTIHQIRDLMQEDYGLNVERRTVYENLEALRTFGMDIIGERHSDGRYFYYLASKTFQIAELKLLVDAIQSSKFITEKKSEELIGKLMTFASDYEAKTLNRQVVVKGRVKTMNASVYYNIDEIHRGISLERKIRFRYYRWDHRKVLVEKKGEYIVSPWALIWDDENYYLLGYDGKMGIMKHYRVDKMKGIDVTEEAREGEEAYASIDLARYSQQTFGMFGGETDRVDLEFIEEFVGVMIDRFGKEIPILPGKRGDGWLRTTVDVTVSEQFLGWIFSLGDGIRITGPAGVVWEYREMLRRVAEGYR